MKLNKTSTYYLIDLKNGLRSTIELGPSPFSATYNIYIGGIVIGEIPITADEKQGAVLVARAITTYQVFTGKQKGSVLWS